MTTPISRDHLPIPDATHVGLTTYDAKDPNTAYPPITTLRPPADAPNVLIVLIDDVGFGASSAFGGPCHTPVAERLAAGGVKLNRFHTTALCSPTRQALLTGRNHHSVGMGAITEMATSAPGNSSDPPQGKGTHRRNPSAQRIFDGPVRQVSRSAGLGGLARMGHSTNGPPDRGSSTSTGSSAARPTSTTRASTKAPPLSNHRSRPRRATRSTRTSPIVRSPGSASRRRSCRTSPSSCTTPPAPRMPRTTYPRNGPTSTRENSTPAGTPCGTTSSPEQKKLGVVPDNAELTRRHARSPPGLTCPTDSSRCWRAKWRSTPAFSSTPTTRSAELIDAIDDLGILDDTLIYYIIGDNGASAEGTLNGCFNEMATLNGMPGIETTEFLLSKIDDFGTPKAYNHYAVGWAHALCAPVPVDQTGRLALGRHPQRNHRALAERHRRQGRDPQPVPPRHRHRADDSGSGRPTRAGVRERHQQAPAGRASACCPHFDDAKAARAHDAQYFEMFGNRGIYHKGWTAVTKHRTPWCDRRRRPPFDDDVWELYGPDDWTQAHDLVGENPEKLAELQRLWLIEAVKYNVLPLDDRGFERINPDIAGRPQLIRGNTPAAVSPACESARTACIHSRTSRIRSPRTSSCRNPVPTESSSPKAAALAAGRSTRMRANSSTASTSSASSTT